MLGLFSAACTMAMVRATQSATSGRAAVPIVVTLRRPASGCWLPSCLLMLLLAGMASWHQQARLLQAAAGCLPRASPPPRRASLARSGLQYERSYPVRLTVLDGQKTV
eukprot:COSAG01_NODE_15483_length_1331_cov_1737.696429_1_plen_108_part_00